MQKGNVNFNTIFNKDVGIEFTMEKCAILSLNKERKLQIPGNFKSKYHQDRKLEISWLGLVSWLVN